MFMLDNRARLAFKLFPLAMHSQKCYVVLFCRLDGENDERTHATNFCKFFLVIAEDKKLHLSNNLRFVAQRGPISW